MTKRAQNYMNQIKEAKNRNELAGIKIAFSQDCSSYKLSWEDFMKLYNAAKERKF